MLRQSAPPLPARAAFKDGAASRRGEKRGAGGAGEENASSPNFHASAPRRKSRPWDKSKGFLSTQNALYQRKKTQTLSAGGRRRGREREPPLMSAQGFSPPRVGGTITSCLPTGTVKYSPRVGESARAQTCAGGKRAEPPCKTSPQGAAPEKCGEARGRGGRKSGVMRGSPPLPHPAQSRGRKNRRKKSASPCPEPRGRTEKKGGTGCRRRGRGRGAGRRLCACFPLPIAGEGHTRKA